MKKLLLVMLIVSSASFAVGQGVFSKNALEYVKSKLPKEEKDSQNKIIDLDAQIKKLLIEFSELNQQKQRNQNEFKYCELRLEELPMEKQQEIKNLSTNNIIDKDKYEEALKEINKRYESMERILKREIDKLSQLIGDLEKKYFENLGKRASIGEEITKEKTKPTFSENLYDYEKLPGSCMAFSALVIKTLMFQWLPKANTGKEVNDINWLIKYYNLVANLYKNPALQKNDELQIDMLLENITSYQKDNGRAAKWADGKYKFGEYAYQGKVRDVFITSSENWRLNAGRTGIFYFYKAKQKAVDTFSSILKSMKGDDLGLGIIVGMSDKNSDEWKKSREGHAVAIYRDPKGQWYAYDPNVGMDSIEALMIKVSEGENPIEKVVEKISEFGAYGNDWELYKITLEQ